MKVKLDNWTVESERYVWNNFVRYHLSKLQAGDALDLDKVLKPYNAQVVHGTQMDIGFNNEKDKLFFILKWA
jgi:hypothetical protein